MKKQLGDDPRLINDGSEKAHNKMKWQMRGFILLIALCLAGIICLILLSSCASRPVKFEWQYVQYENIFLDGEEPPRIDVTPSVFVGDNLLPAVEMSFKSRLSITDTIFPTQFDFESTSQFIVFSDTIEEYHIQQRVIGYPDRIVLAVTLEGANHASFPISNWYKVNDSTIIGDSPYCRAEWQRRWNENAIRVRFVDPNQGPAEFLAFEHYRDTTFVR